MSDPEPTDILVPLYALPAAPAPPDEVAIRRPLAPERHFLTAWVERTFERGWASEVAVATAASPATCLVALEEGRILGFACYDTVARGMFGPTGVAERARGRGIGGALLHATLGAMHAAGYAYAVIGGAGPVDWYLGQVGGIVIPDSWPGLYAGAIERDD